MHSQTYGRVNARVHEKVLVLFQESFNMTTIFLRLRHFLLNVFQEVRKEPIKSKLPYMASTCCCDLAIIAVELTNSSATQNYVVFQPASEQPKCGASGILKRNLKGLCSSPLRLIIWLSARKKLIGKTVDHCFLKQ